MIDNTLKKIGGNCYFKIDLINDPSWTVEYSPDETVMTLLSAKENYWKLISENSVLWLRFYVIYCYESLSKFEYKIANSVVKMKDHFLYCTYWEGHIDGKYWCASWRIPSEDQRALAFYLKLTWKDFWGCNYIAPSLFCQFHYFIVKDGIPNLYSWI